MIETDVLFSHVKDKDWLKEDAETILAKVTKGSFGEVHASRESIHELYYLLSRSGNADAEVLSKVGGLTQITNISWTSTTTEDDLLALSLLTTYRLTSVFDSYHAAACLLRDPEHTMISTDEVYDRIPRLRRIDPRKLADQIRRENRGKGTS